MPKGWRLERLGDHIEIKHGYAFSSDHFTQDGEYCLLTPGNFYEHGGFRWLGNKQKFYNGLFPEEYLLDPGSVLVAMTEQAPGLLGSAAIIPGDHKYLHNQRLGLVVHKTRFIDKEFIYYLFNSIPTKKQLSKTAGGTKVRHTSPQKICSLTVKIPPLKEQRKIVIILTAYDTGIIQTRDLIAAKQRRKNALMQQLLTGQRRLPGFTTPWISIPLKEYFKRVTRRFDGSCNRVLTISGTNGLVDQLDYFNKRVAADNLSTYFMLMQGEFAFNKSSSNGYPFGAIKQLDRYDSGVVSSLYICFKKRSNRTISNTFMKYYFDTGLLNRSLLSIAAEGARCHGLLNITPRDFFNIEITIPELGEQNAIVKILETADSELSALHKQFAALEKQKLGLMQKLLSGEVRVKI